MNEQTQALPPFTFAEEQPPPPRERRSRAGAAGILVGALLLGSIGGFAGAAGYDAWDDDPAATESEPATRTVSPLEPDSGSGSSDDPAPDGSAEAVAKAVLPSVVKINVSSGAGGGSGSGVILSETGEILTNNHVVEVAEGGGELSVSFNDGTTAPASVVGTDPVTDLAVIQAEDVSGLTPAKLGDSSKLDVGQVVVAIGSPYGLDATVTSGIVSSLNRPVTVGGDDDATIYPAIQTDAAINPGNSGGPLVNLAGQLVGINSSIRTSSSGLGEGGSIGLGFAIPITNVLPIVEQLRNGETPTHARLGVTAKNIINEDGLVTGAGIESVEPGSAAESAGVEVGDVVTRVDDQPISGLESLIATIRGYRPGDDVTLTVVRDGETLTLDASLDSDEGATD